MNPSRSDGDLSQPVLPPVFLERQSYRRRRLMDAARLLPVLGALLFAVPLLWTGADSAGSGDPTPTSRAILYIFTAWALLILATVWFGFRTRGWNRAEGDQKEDPAALGQDAN